LNPQRRSMVAVGLISCRLSSFGVVPSMRTLTLMSPPPLGLSHRGERRTCCPHDLALGVLCTRVSGADGMAPQGLSSLRSGAAKYWIMTVTVRLSKCQIRTQRRAGPAPLSPDAGPTAFFVFRVAAFLTGALFGAASCVLVLRVAGVNPAGRRLTSVGSSR